MVKMMLNCLPYINIMQEIIIITCYINNNNNKFNNYNNKGNCKIVFKIRVNYNN